MPDRIGHYRIVRQIGRGGMGIVYEAIDERLQRPVAIEALLPASDPQMRDRLLREARGVSRGRRFRPRHPACAREGLEGAVSVG